MYICIHTRDVGAGRRDAARARLYGVLEGFKSSERNPRDSGVGFFSPIKNEEKKKNDNEIKKIYI